MKPELSRKNPWRISKHKYYACMHYAYQYKEWIDEYNSLSDTLRSPGYDGMPHGSGISKPTENAGLRRAELMQNITMIEDTAMEADKDLYKYLLRSVTDENVDYRYLDSVMNIPVSHNTFYDRRRKFYYLLSKKIC